MNERQAYILLNLVPQVGPIRARRLVERFGSAAAIFEAPEEELCAVKGIGPETARALLRAADELDPGEEESRAQSLGGWILAWPDPGYPAALRRTPDPPLALYGLGELQARDRHAVAVVGSRRCTLYGREVAERFGFSLARAGITVVSGLARGIDACAHRGALETGTTVAVLGAGLDRIYPPEHRELAQRIRRRGALVSEFLPGEPPRAWHFPLRNRVISGLSLGVVVIEASERSGALEQGREVFAVPGAPASPWSRGTHGLLRRGAKLAESAGDVLAEVLPQMERPPWWGHPLLRALSEGPRSVDELVMRCGRPVQEVLAELVELESRGAVRRVAPAVFALDLPPLVD